VIDAPALTVQPDVHAPVAIAHRYLANLPDPMLKVCMPPAGLVVVGEAVEPESLTGPAD
jgi:hypothetical protein